MSGIPTIGLPRQIPLALWPAAQAVANLKRRKMKPSRLLVPAVISVITAGPVGGFIFGFMSCSDCGWNVVGRAFIGCVMAVLVPVHGGFPPQNEGGVGPRSNAWPHIAFGGLLVF